MSKNILVYFLREHGSEVENMLITEWNTEEAIAVAREEAMEEGVAIGEARGVAIGETRGVEKVFSLLEQGVSLSEAKRRLGLG
jgi:hypothetical protein